MKYCFLISKLTVERDVFFLCQASGLGKVGENFDLKRLTWKFRVASDFMTVFLKENR